MKKYRDEIINFVRDKTLMNDKEILDKRVKSNTLNVLGKKNLAKSILSKDYTKNLANDKWLECLECKRKCGLPFNLAFHYSICQEDKN